MNDQKTIAFDLDDTLCYRESNECGVEKYRNCMPIDENIAIANECYDAGYKIIIYTARGMSIFYGNQDDVYSNLYSFTEKQLKSWGIKYHQLIMGKIHFDLLIDDKVANIEAITSLSDIEDIIL